MTKTLMTPPSRQRYNNTFSTNNGSINYAVVDLGYDVLRNADYKVGPFVGYTVFNQYIFKVRLSADRKFDRQLRRRYGDSSHSKFAADRS